jgi:hypothetical protein
MKYGGTDCQMIHGTDTDDTFSMIISGLPRDCYDFAVVLYRCENQLEDIASRNQWQDDDLFENCFEPDGQTSVIYLHDKIPSVLQSDRSVTVTEGRAAVNPYGGVKEADPVTTADSLEREGRGRPAPGAR